MATVGLRTGRSLALHSSKWSTVATRRYASTALKQKTKQDTSTSSSSSGKTTSTSKSETQPSNATRKPKKGELATSAEENLQAMEAMRRFKKMYATADVWGSDMENLDTEIPYDLRSMAGSLFARPILAPSKFADLWYAVKLNTRNWMKNTYSMYAMAKANAFPGRTVKTDFWTLGRILSVRNTSRDALLAPFRQVALETYRKVNTSIARGREVTVREYTAGPFEEKSVKALRRREKGQTWTWTLASDVSDSALYPKKNRRGPTPVDVVSLRAGEVYTEDADPINGHRLLIQALVKFDTTHKIDILDKHNQPVHSDLTGTRTVVQYLLLEKVGWYDTPWRIKEQFYKA